MVLKDNNSADTKRTSRLFIHTYVNSSTYTNMHT